MLGDGAAVEVFSVTTGVVTDEEVATVVTLEIVVEAVIGIKVEGLVEITVMVVVSTKAVEGATEEMVVVVDKSCLFW